jgi:uncharacterized membrane protein
VQDDTDRTAAPGRAFTAAEIGALAHLYRAEVYRSTIWRTRLDTTTNWSVVTLGVALSITFSSNGASPLPLILVGVLIAFFMMLEARRYRYFNVWRARARWMENHFYAPMLADGDLHLEEDWQRTLARDYTRPAYHISYLTALGRRLRYTYIWLFMIQTVAYFGKITVHPAPLASLEELWARASVGPASGQTMLALGLLFNLTWLGLALWTYRIDLGRRRARGERAAVAMG